MKLHSAGRMVGSAGGTRDTKQLFPADNRSQVLAITVSAACTEGLAGVMEYKGPRHSKWDN